MEKEAFYIRASCRDMNCPNNSEKHLHYKEIPKKEWFELINNRRAGIIDDNTIELESEDRGIFKKILRGYRKSKEGFYPRIYHDCNKSSNLGCNGCPIKMLEERASSSARM